ncbi:hypothetical protein LINPERPRIM_LOCUS15736, partial [Linum perenne]
MKRAVRFLFFRVMHSLFVVVGGWFLPWFFFWYWFLCVVDRDGRFVICIASGESSVFCRELSWIFI